MLGCEQLIRPRLRLSGSCHCHLLCALEMDRGRLSPSSPIAPAPPGLKSNFIDPPSRKSEVIGVISTFTALGLISVVLRMHTRVFISRAVGWDDCRYLRSMRDFHLMTDSSRRQYVGSGEKQSLGLARACQSWPDGLTHLVLRRCRLRSRAYI